MNIQTDGWKASANVAKHLEFFAMVSYTNPRIWRISRHHLHFHRMLASHRNIHNITNANFIKLVNGTKENVTRNDSERRLKSQIKRIVYKSNDDVFKFEISYEWSVCWMNWNVINHKPSNWKKKKNVRVDGICTKSDVPLRMQLFSFQQNGWQRPKWKVFNKLTSASSPRSVTITF